MDVDHIIYLAGSYPDEDTCIFSRLNAAPETCLKKKKSQRGTLKEAWLLVQSACPLGISENWGH